MYNIVYPYTFVFLYILYIILDWKLLRWVLYLIHFLSWILAYCLLNFILAYLELLHLKELNP